MKKIYLLFIITISYTLFASCAVYQINNKTFTSQKEALSYFQTIITGEINRVKKCTYIGSSIMVYIPPDNILALPPFMTGSGSEELKSFIIDYYKCDFNGIVDALIKSQMFDSVKGVQIEGYLRYAKEHGFRYLYVKYGDDTATIHDLLTSTDKSIRSTKGLDNVVYVIEDTILQFEANKSSQLIIKDYKPINEEYKYDEKTKKGFISVQGKGLAARAWMMQTIGEICSSKNVALKSGTKTEPGYFLVLDEDLTNDKFTIYFESLY